ncbi:MULTISPECIES: GerW family sporulation protein [Clostridium]|uniref:GerW family sporulation protein n=1 Tax=Clostridium TaxID=1485 RepID=UPI000825C6EC|nr:MULTISPECIES: GerW family sporulation protein [Clostridium]PJI08738.1 sporulation protein [Clostridium sp. CT7]
MENNIKENLDVLFTKLEKFLRTETVVGEPIKVGETTLIPIISVMFGCGTGSGTGDNKGIKGEGGGLGAGARVTPNAILVIKNDEVTMLPVKNRGNLDKLLEMVPEIVSKVKCDKDKKEKTEEKDKEESKEEE